MEFNPSGKCNVVHHVQQAKKSPDIQLLPPWANTGNNKYLGIIIRSDLPWSTHVEEEETGRWGSCEGKSGSVPQKSSRRPTLQWYAPYWSMPDLSGVHTSTIKDIQLLEKVQRLAARYVTNNYAQITCRHCYIHARESEVDKS